MTSNVNLKLDQYSTMLAHAHILVLVLKFTHSSLAYCSSVLPGEYEYKVINYKIHEINLNDV